MHPGAESCRNVVVWCLPLESRRIFPTCYSSRHDGIRVLVAWCPLHVHTVVGRSSATLFFNGK